MLYGNDSTAGVWAYTYDDFNRLASATCNGGTVWPGQKCPNGGTLQSFTYVYDRFGNRWQQNAPQGGPAPQYTFDGHNHIATGGYSYDVAGNETNDTFLSYTLNYNGQITQLSNSSGTVSYTYDGLGRRTSQTVNGTTQDYFYTPANQLAETVTPAGSRVRAEVYVGARHLGYYNASGTMFYTWTDWNGSERNESADTNWGYAFCGDYIFGDGINCTKSSVLPTFAGQWYDTAIHTHAENREYSPTQGNWLRPDPAGLAAVDPMNPQSWNRYAYVLNNPATLTDPNGLCPPGDIVSRICIDFGGTGGYGGGWLGGYGGDGGYNTGVGFDTPPVSGTTNLAACSVDVFCIQNGGVAAFNSPVAQHRCVGNWCMAGSYMFSQYNVGGTYTWDWRAQKDAEVDWAIKAFLNQEGHIAAGLQTTVEKLRAAYLNPDDGSLKDPDNLNQLNPLRQGGNWNFYTSQDFGCTHGRCGSIPSLHFKNGFVHLDTANPYWGYGIGFVIHGVWDGGFGNTIFANGIPR